jgi:hypothetical protein
MDTTLPLMAEAMRNSQRVKATYLPATNPTCFTFVRTTPATLLALFEILAVLVVPNIRRSVEPKLG